MRRLAAVPADRLHLILMLVLTFSTGVVDAVGFLGLDRVFTGNMTGNVVILGMGLLGAEGLPVLGPVIALLGFLAGAALGGRVLKRSDAAWTPQTTWLLALVGVVITVLAITLLVVGDDLADTVARSVTALLGAAMGLQAATARAVGVRDVTTVVVTSTITGLAADSRLGAGRGRGHSGRRVMAVLLILCGAAVGAALQSIQLGVGLLLAGVVVLVVSLVGGVHAAGTAYGRSHA